MNEAYDTAVLKVLNGDIDAFETLVRKLGPELRAWLAVRCPPGLEADELAHRCFIKAYENLAQYKPSSQFPAWLFTIAKNILLAEIKRLRETRIVNAGPLDLFLGHVQEQSAMSDTEDRRLELLRGCLQLLAEPARQLIEERYTADRSIRDMAAQSQRSEGAIMKSLSLIRRKLHECVDRKLDQELAS